VRIVPNVDLDLWSSRACAFPPELQVLLVRDYTLTFESIFHLLLSTGVGSLRHLLLCSGWREPIHEVYHRLLMRALGPGWMLLRVLDKILDSFILNFLIEGVVTGLILSMSLRELSQISIAETEGSSCALGAQKLTFRALEALITA